MIHLAVVWDLNIIIGGNMMKIHIYKLDEMKISVSNILLVLLALYSLNFFGLGNYFILLLFVVQIFTYKRLNINMGFFMLLIACITRLIIECLMNTIPSIQTVFGNYINPAIAFLIGSFLIRFGKEYCEKVVYIFCFGYALHGTLNMLYTGNDSYIMLQERALRDIWGGMQTATGHNLYFVVICSLLFYFLFIEKSRKRFLGFAFIAVGIYGTFVNASRTLLLILLIVFFAASIIYVYKLNKMSLRQAFKICLWIGGLLIVLLLLYNYNFLGIKDAVWKSDLMKRFVTTNRTIGAGITHDNLRLKYTQDILRILPKYPLGNMPYQHYAHNLWVDIARENGIIPFIAYIVFEIYCLLIMLKWLLREKDLHDIVFYGSVFLGISIPMFTEPILQGVPYFFEMFSLFMGIMVGLSNYTKYDRKNHVAAFSGGKVSLLYSDRLKNDGVIYNE